MRGINILIQSITLYEYVNNKEVHHEYVKSQDQVADVFMKNLVFDAFNKI